jgi:hypothetical protein
MKEHTEDLLVTQIFGLCMSKPLSIEDMTNKIYKNLYAKNIVRVYQCCEILMKRGILIPKFHNRTLLFQINDDIIGRIKHVE